MRPTLLLPNFFSLTHNAAGVQVLQAARYVQQAQRDDALQTGGNGAVQGQVGQGGWGWVRPASTSARYRQHPPLAHQVNPRSLLLLERAADNRIRQAALLRKLRDDPGLVEAAASIWQAQAQGTGE